jgi:hypothetical protein
MAQTCSKLNCASIYKILVPEQLYIYISATVLLSLMSQHLHVLGYYVPIYPTAGIIIVYIISQTQRISRQLVGLMINSVFVL